MAVSSQRRSGGALVLSPQIVLLTQSLWVTINFSMIVGTGHRVPNLRLVGFSQLHPTNLIDIMGVRTMGFMKKGRKSVFTMVKLVTFSVTVMLGWLQGLVKFLWLLYLLLY